MKDKFQTLQPWLSQILYTIKKEIKAEHLLKSPAFYKMHFGTRPINRVTNEEICEVYEKELILEDREEMREWVVNRWVFRHGDIYQHFADRLSQIHPDFDQIENLTDAQSEQVLSGSVESFGALDVYLFVVLNGVVLSSLVVNRLKLQAEKEQAEFKKMGEETGRTESLEKALERCQNDLLRLEKKYEEKLSGVMLKHATDVNALKNQVRSLQKRVNA